MIYALAIAAAVEYQSLNPRQCPGDALGYVRAIKDGFLIAGGTARVDPHTGILTAWFPPQRSTAQVAMTLDLRPNAREHVQLRTEGRGSIRLHRGVFCAYPEPPPKPSLDYTLPPSELPSEVPP